MLNIQRFVVNMIEENCYLLWDDTCEAAIVDCGAYSENDRETIRRFIEDHHLTIKLHLLTHSHFDHIFGAQFVFDTYGLGPSLSKEEAECYRTAPEQMKRFLHRELPLLLPAAEQFFSAGDTLRFGRQEIQVIATPGHTPGGVCFYLPAEGILLSGDSLFDGSIGRTDFPGGNADDLVSSLKERILTLPDEVAVLPGHGPQTTIGNERRYNPWLA